MNEQANTALIQKLYDALTMMSSGSSKVLPFYSCGAGCQRGGLVTRLGHYLIGR